MPPEMNFFVMSQFFKTMGEVTSCTDALGKALTAHAECVKQGRKNDEPKLRENVHSVIDAFMDKNAEMERFLKKHPELRKG